MIIILRVPIYLQLVPSVSSSKIFIVYFPNFSNIVNEKSTHDPEFEGLNLLPLVMGVNSNKKIIVQFASGCNKANNSFS